MKKRIGLALGNGTVKGFAHIGVLKVLEKYNIKIDAIAGTSAGALIGALYTSGLKAKEIENIVLKIDWQNLLDFTFPRKGVMLGDKLEDLISKLTKGKYFNELDIPFYCTAVDINTGKLIIFDSGDVAMAVRASVSIPGFFVPVEFKDMKLVDGGILDPIPVDVLKQRKINKVIAVKLGKQISELTVKAEGSKFADEFKKTFIKDEINELNRFVESGEIKLPFFIQMLFNPKKIAAYNKSLNVEVPDFFNVLQKSMAITRNRLEDISLGKADLIIAPKLPGINQLEFDQIKFIIKQGEKAAEQEIKKIKKLYKQ